MVTLFSFRGDQRGLTLAELLVTLAIVAIVAAASATAAVRSSQAAAVRTGAEWTATVLRQAARAAWVEQAPVRVQFHPGTPFIAVYRWTGNGWADISGAFSARWLPGGDAPPAGVIIQSTTYPHNFFMARHTSIDAEGVVNVFPSTTEGQVVLQGRGGVTLRVMTSLAGLVTVAR
jgi:prepilin-type N-terminal cleavage/methylation domain-containing protein